MVCHAARRLLTSFLHPIVTATRCLSSACHKPRELWDAVWHIKHTSPAPNLRVSNLRRRAQKRFRERQKVKQQEAVQRVVQLEDALDRLEVERSELSQKLEAMAHVRGGGGGGHGEMSGAAKAEDSGSEVRNEFGAGRTARPGPHCGRAAPSCAPFQGAMCNVV